ncbi:MAG: hypothetical protein CMJ81_05535 [Planctomycetaceae bacterium]|nr:hypothetical protein [Planctomycetaceae bacterium]
MASLAQDQRRCGLAEIKRQVAGWKRPTVRATVSVPPASSYQLNREENGPAPGTAKCQERNIGSAGAAKLPLLIDCGRRASFRKKPGKKIGLTAKPLDEG